VGASFAGAVRTYAELSGLHGTSGGVGEAFSPLIGVWAPTFSAYELVAAFLLPFLAIRVFSFDRQTGASKLEWQRPLPPMARVGAKAAVLAGAWAVASVPALLALALWMSYGGAVYWRELVPVWLGHLLNAALTIALAAAAAAVSEHPATAAILTLGFTVGTWVVSFAAAVHGGWWERIASLTPPMLVGVFQQGLLRLDLALIALALIGAGLVLAAVWMRTGVALRRRLLESAGVAAAAVACVLAATPVRASWDLTEGRANSFPAADERALRGIEGPLTMEVHLAAEDARRADLERRVIARLRRVTDLRVRYASATSVGLFEQTDPRYGEVAYEWNGRRASSRVFTAEGVLETVYTLAGVTPPEDDDRDAFRGHPLPMPPRGAGTAFYVVWPALVLGAAALTLRRPR
jgi:hypothetical protein